MEDSAKVPEEVTSEGREEEREEQVILEAKGTECLRKRDPPTLSNPADSSCKTGSENWPLSVSVMPVWISIVP